jgi:hypothetical protein
MTVILFQFFPVKDRRYTTHSLCRTRWGRYGLPPIVIPRKNAIRSSYPWIFKIKKVPADLHVPFQNPWLAPSIRCLESLTIFVINPMYTFLAQWNRNPMIIYHVYQP